MCIDLVCLQSADDHAGLSGARTPAADSATLNMDHSASRRSSDDNEKKGASSHGHDLEKAPTEPPAAATAAAAAGVVDESLIVTGLPLVLIFTGMLLS